MARKKITVDRWVNNLTSQQYRKLIDIADPLTEEQKVKFDAMTDDEILAELRENKTPWQSPGNASAKPATTKC